MKDKLGRWRTQSLFKEYKQGRRPSGRERNQGGQRQKSAAKEAEPSAALPEKKEEKGLLSRIKSAIGGK